MAPDRLTDGGEVRRAYPNPRRVVLAAWLALGTGLSIIAGLLTLPVAWLRTEVWEPLYVTVISLVVLAWGTYLTLAATLRCPGCGQRFLLGSRGPRRPAARKAWNSDGLEMLVSEIIFYHEFTCGECGARWRLR